AEGEFGLATVEPGSRHGDRERDAHVRAERGSVDPAALLEGAIGASDAALAVDDEGDHVVLARDPAIGAQLTQRESEVADAVSGDRERLAHHGDAAGAAGCRQGVLMGALGLVIDQLGGHREVASCLLGVLLAERLEFVARSRVEVARSDLVRERRLGDALAHRRVLVVRTVDAAARTVPEGSAVCRIAAVTVGATVALAAVASERTVTRAAAVAGRATLARLA